MLVFGIHYAFLLIPNIALVIIGICVSVGVVPVAPAFTLGTEAIVKVVFALQHTLIFLLNEILASPPALTVSALIVDGISIPS